MQFLISKGLQNKRLSQCRPWQDASFGQWQRSPSKCIGLSEKVPSGSSLGWPMGQQDYKHYYGRSPKPLVNQLLGLWNPSITHCLVGYYLVLQADESIQAESGLAIAQWQSAGLAKSARSPGFNPLSKTTTTTTKHHQSKLGSYFKRRKECTGRDCFIRRPLLCGQASFLLKSLCILSTG